MFRPAVKALLVLTAHHWLKRSQPPQTKHTTYQVRSRAHTLQVEAPPAAGMQHKQLHARPGPARSGLPLAAALPTSHIHGGDICLDSSPTLSLQVSVTRCLPAVLFWERACYLHWQRTLWLSRKWWIKTTSFISNDTSPDECSGLNEAHYSYKLFAWWFWRSCCQLGFSVEVALEKKPFLNPVAHIQQPCVVCLRAST